MKKIKVILFSVAFLLTGIAFTSCSSSTASDSAKDGKEYTSAYICPMHCPKSGSAEAGKCPVCKMDYVANKDHKSDDSHDGHDHDHNHDHDGEDHKGHDHGSHDGHDH